MNNYNAPISNGVFKDNDSLLSCIAFQYNTLKNYTYLFESLRRNQCLLKNYNTSNNSLKGCVSAFILFIMIAGTICTSVSVIEALLKEKSIDIILTILSELIFITPFAIYFLIAKPIAKRKNKKKQEHLRSETNKTCESLWRIYDEQCYKSIPFEYSEPDMLRNLYNTAYKHKLTTISDTINIYIEEQHIEAMHELDKKASLFENTCCQTLRNYALMKIVTPRKTNIIIH